MPSAGRRLLDGKVAVVTGGGKGIGRAIALAVAESGGRVVVAARERPALEKTAGMIRSTGGDGLVIEADVTQENAVTGLIEETIRHYGTIDVLVNNAGIAGPTAGVEEIPASDWDEVLRVNLMGPFLCSRAVVSEMKRKASGRIINVGSISGKYPLPQRTPYCASKMGLVGLTRSLASELGPHDVTVNAVSPGATSGERLNGVIERAARAQGKSVEELSQAVLSSTPLRRFVEPEDVARVVVFLASDLARNITGEDINVAAGVRMD